MTTRMDCGCSRAVYRPSPGMNHPATIWHLFWVGFLCGVLIIGGLFQTGHAEGVGRIQGVIQQGGKGFPEQRIMLIRFGPNQDVQRFPGQTDTAGRFLFENLEIGPGFTYFVGVRYKEQLHRSEPVILQSAEPVEVVLEVREQPVQETQESDKAPKLRIMNHLMVIVRRDTHLEVREVVKIANTGTTPYIDKVGRGGATGISLHLPLPQGHYNIGQVQGLSPADVHVDASGLSYLAPLPPGEHQVVYTYNLPWHDALATILVERTLTTSQLDVLVDDEHLNATSDLQFGGRIPIDPHVFAHFRGMHLEAHSRSWLQLTPRQTSASLLHTGAYGLIVGIMLLGLGIPFYNVWHDQAQLEDRETDVLLPTQRSNAKGVGRYLLRSIAQLDDDYDGGRVDADTYQQRRQAYKEQLCKLIEELQRVEVSQKMLEMRR